MTKERLKTWAFVLSLTANVVITLPAIAILAFSTDFHLLVHKHLQARFGRPEIAFIGDSITLGGGMWGLRINTNPLNTWNYGHGGFTTHQLRYYAQDVARQKGFRYAFVMAGINDEDQTPAGAATSFADYKTILDTLMQAGVTPVIQLTLYREHEHAPAFIKGLNASLTNYAARRGLYVIDLNPILAPRGSLLPEYSRDGIHLKEAGYQIWAKKIRIVLASMHSKPGVSTGR